jgi:hypothetical protein
MFDIISDNMLELLKMCQWFYKLIDKQVNCTERCQRLLRDLNDDVNEINIFVYFLDYPTTVLIQNY